MQQRNFYLTDCMVFINQIQKNFPKVEMEKKQDIVQI